MNASDTSWTRDEGEVLGRLRRMDAGIAAIPEIPGYQHIVEIGRGGQGVVFAAMQSATRRRVAIKVLLTSVSGDAAARARFEREVELAARLRHPNVVRVYDGGVTLDGRPFCAMDLIDGEPLDRTLRDLPNADRARRAVELLRDVARGVHHAHQRGVIHRDLKPTNIRVTPGGAPVVVDFGLAKTIDGEAHHDITVTSGHFLGSLAWASPEQASGRTADIDTRTDIYALGVILHHALTGRPPYPIDGSLTETLRRIETGEPESPRRLNPAVTRDLERVVRRCLEKAKDDRYSSAEELADDLERVLQGEPILGGGATAWRATRRRIVRYRVGLAVAAVAILALTAFSATSLVLLERARTAERSAVAESDRANRVTDFLKRSLESADPAAMGRETTLRDFISTVERELAAGTDLTPGERAELHSVIATTYRGLGDFDAALDHAQTAVDLAPDTNQAAREVRLGYRTQTAGLLIDLSRFDEAQAETDTLLPTLEAQLGETHPITLRARGQLAFLLSEKGQFAEAIALHETVYRARRDTLGPDHNETLTSLHNRAVEHNLAGQPERALEAYAVTLARYEATRGTDHPATIDARNGYAATLHNLGRLEEADAMFSELVPDAERVLGEDHALTNAIRNNHAFLMRDLGRLEDARDITREVYNSFLRTLGPSHSSTANARTGLAVTSYFLGDTDTAIRLLQESYDRSVETLGPANIRSIDAGKSLATVLRNEGQLDQALRVARAVLTGSEEFYGETSRDLLPALRLVASIELSSELFTEAMATSSRMTELARANEQPETLAHALEVSGDAAAALGSHADATEYYRQALDTRSKLNATDNNDRERLLSKLEQLTE